MLQNKNLNTVIGWHLRCMQKQRQQVEALIPMPSKLLCEKIIQNCRQKGFTITSNNDDRALTVVAGSAEIKCRLKSETAGSTTVCINTDYYSPRWVRSLAFGAFGIVFIEKTINLSISERLLELAVFTFFSCVIYFEMQKAKAVEGIEQFKTCLQESVHE